MEYLVDGWPVIVGLMALAGVGVVAIWQFMNRPTGEQMAAVKEWLVWAVTEAEKGMGSGTGKLKLRQVYDMFLQRFPAVARVIPFEMFSGWVDEALERMKAMLASNTSVQKYVEGAHDEG